MQTFEEMIQYGFIDDWYLTCFGATATPNARFIEHHAQKVAMPLRRPPLADEELVCLTHFRVSVRLELPRRRGVIAKEALQRILQALPEQDVEQVVSPRQRFETKSTREQKRDPEGKLEGGSSSRKPKK